jgi:hypothetical protein
MQNAECRMQSECCSPGGDCPDVANRSASDADIGCDLICRAESQRDSIIEPSKERATMDWA